MIKNDRHYRITKTQAERFREAIEELDRAAPDNSVDPVLQRAEIEGLRSQLADLETELRDYEDLRSGRRPVATARSLEDLPRALVEARIAAGLTQEDLALRLGLKPQQVQRYEATDYQGASLARIAEVAGALRLAAPNELVALGPDTSVRGLMGRLKGVGLTRDFIVRRLLPRRPVTRDEEDGTEDVSKVGLEAAEALNHVYGWTPAALFGPDPLALPTGAAATGRFQLPSRVRAAGLGAYVVYAHYLALLALDTTAHLEAKPLPTSPEQLRAAILHAYGEINFATVLEYIWSLGVPVLPLNDPGQFHGACWRVSNRNVIVLKQKTNSSARWLHDLLHEYWHAAHEPHLEEHPIIEESELSVSRRASADERSASRFAGDVVLAGQAEELAELSVAAAGGSVERLKHAVRSVATDAHVPLDALANYMAFRLSLQGINWWGAATNLQAETPLPSRSPRDLLLRSAEFGRLNPTDRDLLLRALEPLVLVFSGKIGSGKSTLADRVATALGWKRASCGDFIRAVARSQGLEDQREVLQELGAELVARSPGEFCRALLAHFNWHGGEPLVLDGVRHAEVLEALRRVVAPLQVRLVYVETDEAVRRERLRLEEEDTPATQFPKLEAHSTEQQVGSRLAAAAQLRVSGTRRPPDVVRDIVDWVHKGDGTDERAA